MQRYPLAPITNIQRSPQKHNTKAPKSTSPLKKQRRNDENLFVIFQDDRVPSNHTENNDDDIEDKENRTVDQENLVVKRDKSTKRKFLGDLNIHAVPGFISYNKNILRSSSKQQLTIPWNKSFKDERSPVKLRERSKSDGCEGPTCVIYRD